MKKHKPSQSVLNPTISRCIALIRRISIRGILTCGISICGILPTLSAQTVRPLIAELGNPAKGRIEYVNDSLTPLNVVLEVRSFTVAEDGQISYRPLDPNIHLRLSVTSFRLMPQQSYFVFYEANTDASPAWFVIYAAFSGFPFRTQQGMNVRLELPHTVYLLPKGSLKQADVVVKHAEFVPTQKKLVLEIENTGSNFGRVQETLVAFGRKKQDAPGFAVFPHSKRRMEIPLEQDGPPSGVELQFPNFKVEQSQIDEAKMDETKANGTNTDGTKIDGTKTDETKTDETKIDETKTDQPVPAPKP